MRRFLIALLLAITAVGAMAQTTIPPGVNIQDEGVAQGRAQTLNCTGAGVDCTVSSGTATVNVTAGGGGAPTNAQYLTGAADATLSAERVVTNTASATWDLTVAGQARVSVATGGVTNALLRDSGALSVIGRSANSTGSPADISATAASDAVLRESGSTVGFGTIATAGIANAAVSYAKIQNMSGGSLLLGRGSSGGGAPQEITVGSNLTMSGTTLSASGGSDPWTTLTSSGDVSGSTGGTLFDVTGISFTAAANTNYLMECWLIVLSSSATSGPGFAWNTPASPTDIYGTWYSTTTTAGVAGAGQTAADDTVTVSMGAFVLSTKQLVRFSTLFRNGANSGTVQLRAAPELSSNLTVYQNSVCQYRSI